MARRWESLLWLGGAALLLVIFLLRGDREPILALSWPRSPLSTISKDAALQWRLLQKASPHIPQGARFTVRADDLGKEMSLLMMAHGVLVRREPLPSSYHGAVKDEGKSADYAILQTPMTTDHPDWKRIVQFPEGAIYRRLR